MDDSPPGSSVHGILQAGILEWVAMPTSKGTFPNQGSNLCLSYPALQDKFFTTSATWEALLHLRLCNKPNQNVLARNNHYFPRNGGGWGGTLDYSFHIFLTLFGTLTKQGVPDTWWKHTRNETHKLHQTYLVTPIFPVSLLTARFHLHTCPSWDGSGWSMTLLDFP